MEYMYNVNILYRGVNIIFYYGVIKLFAQVGTFCPCLNISAKCEVFYLRAQTQFGHRETILYRKIFTRKSYIIIIICRNIYIYILVRVGLHLPFKNKN